MRGKFAKTGDRAKGHWFAEPVWNQHGNFSLARLSDSVLRTRETIASAESASSAFAPRWTFAVTGANIDGYGREAKRG
jgi:hypothetical protein